MSQVFKDFDLSSVWKTNSWALPQSFIELMAVQNGGIFVKNCFPTTQRNSWAKDHVQICEISGIGFEKEGSLCGAMGQKLWLEE